jgi:predicted transposase YbfD/YdcC
VSALSVLPIVAALDQVEVDPDRVSAVVAAPGGELSLVDALSTVPDPRKARGVRHGVLAVLTLSACAVLAGARSFAAVAEYAHDVGAVLLNTLGLTDTAASRSSAGGGVPVPHESTLRRVLQAVDPAGLEAALRAWTLAQLDTRPAPADVPVREQRRVLALDGKTLRGAHLPADHVEPDVGAGGPAAGVRRPHLVSVLDQASGTVLGQVAVDAKSSEVCAFTALLDTIDLSGVLVSADALHTQRGHAEYLHARGGHYLLTVKANQPTLLARLRALPWPQIGVAARERAHGHGRVETRTISVVSLHPCPDAGGEFFPHAEQAIKIVRRRRPARPGGRWKTVTAYAITSLTGRDADPVLLARWVRGHWSIENRLHWVRDVTYDEDRSAVRTGHGPQVMAAFRNLAITALRLSGVTNIAAGLRHHARDAFRPLATFKIM